MEALVRDYYRAIDEGDYAALEDLLAPDFVQHRPDRTLEGRDRFIEFMRDERPDPDTTHELAAVFGGEGGVAAEGRLLRASGAEWFRFVDVFDVTDDRLASHRTYTNGA
jgi:ketosteroid isomerase-like protein